jgi:uncharacterized membrane protein YhaH (DUF805 family)
MAAVNPVNPYRAPAAAVAYSAAEFQEARLFAVSGRIGRVRYIGYTIGVWLAGSMIAGGLGALGKFGAVLGMLVYLAMIVLMFTLAIQRSHDFNTTGWLALLVLVPLVNFIFWFIPGTDGENDYGPPTPPNSTLTIVLVLVAPILIIAILAAIALPAYNDYVKRAKAMQMQKK